MALLPDSPRVVSGATAQTVKVWDLVSDALLRIHEGRAHWFNANAVAVTEDGRRVLSASNGVTLKVGNWTRARSSPQFTGDDPLPACDVTPEDLPVIGGDATGHLQFFRLDGV